MLDPVSIPAWLIALLAPVLLVLGAFAYRAWAKRVERKSRQLPRRWPLHVRTLVNSDELRVWHWLSRTFYDHHVMIKLPVTRFTLPRDPEQGKVWYSLLASVYCTFTICRTDGRVIGCVDVPGRSGLRSSIRKLKLSLLTQCGLPYWVVKADELPTVSEIRGEFLGETPTAQTMRDSEPETAAIVSAKESLRSVIERRRRNRSGNTDYGGLSSWPNSTQGDIPSQWGENSFLLPLDSRKGDLL